MADICKSGCWVDKATGAVVDSPPVEGRLLVAPGGVLTPDINASIERARAVAPAGETATVEPAAVESTEVVETAETATVAKGGQTAASTPTRKR